MFSLSETNQGLRVDHLNVFSLRQHIEVLWIGSMERLSISAIITLFEASTKIFDSAQNYIKLT